MTGREKIEAALSTAGAEQAPVVICYEGIYIRDHWDQLVSMPWWYQFSPKLEEQLAWRRAAIERTPQDWFGLPLGPSRSERAAMLIERRADGVFRVNRLTGSQEKLTPPAVGGWDPAGISRHIAPRRLPTTIDEVDASIAPAAEFDAARFEAEGRTDLARLMLQEFGRYLFPLAGTISPLWSCYYLWGFEGMMLLIAQRPDLVIRACQRYLEHCLLAVRQAAAAGAAGVWIEECMTDMISPAAYAKLNMPVMQKLIDEIRALRIKSIYYYCGNPAGKWDHILSLGMDALALEESKKTFEIDIDHVVHRAAGRCTILGNLDAISVLQNAADEQLRAEITRQLAAGRKNANRFIMSIGSPVTPNTPVERVRQYCQMVHTLSRP